MAYLKERPPQTSLSSLDCTNGEVQRAAGGNDEGDAETEAVRKMMEVAKKERQAGTDGSGEDKNSANSPSGLFRFWATDGDDALSLFSLVRSTFHVHIWLEDHRVSTKEE